MKDEKIFRTKEEAGQASELADELLSIHMVPIYDDEGNLMTKDEVVERIKNNYRR